MPMQNNMHRKWSLLLLLVTVSTIISLSLMASFTRNDWSLALGSFGSRTGQAPPTSNQEDIYVDDSIAKALMEEIRVLCWIYTTVQSFTDKAAAVNFTWAPRCTKHVYVVSMTKSESVRAKSQTGTGSGGSSAANGNQRNVYSDGIGNSFNVEVAGDILYIDSPDGWDNLTEKTRKVLTYLYHTELENFDWFLKGDDDTYVIMENLRFLLSHSNSNDPVYTGFHLENSFFEDPYMSGGAGYVISRAGLRALVEKGLRVKGSCAERGSYEDVEIGRCAVVAGVSILSSTDTFERETFHPDAPKDFIPGPPMQWLYSYARNKPKGGSECCSQFSITFHRLSAQQILIIDHLLYRTSVHGRLIPGSIPQFHTGKIVKRLPKGIPTLSPAT